MKKKSLLFFGITTISLGLLVGCGGDIEDPIEDPAVDDPGVEDPAGDLE